MLICFHIKVKDDIPYGCKHNKRSCHGGGHCFKIVPSILKTHHGNHKIIWIVKFFWGELHYLQSFNHQTSCRFIMFQKSFQVFKTLENPSIDNHFFSFHKFFFFHVKCANGSFSKEDFNVDD